MVEDRGKESLDQANGGMNEKKGKVRAERRKRLR
jgi:hypothetical protein